MKYILAAGIPVIIFIVVYDAVKPIKSKLLTLIVFAVVGFFSWLLMTFLLTGNTW